MQFVSLLQEQSKPYDSKKNFWVPDAEEGFVAGEIKATKGDQITLAAGKGGEVRTSGVRADAQG